jgi:hypothetical protein
VRSDVDDFVASCTTGEDVHVAGCL